MDDSYIFGNLIINAVGEYFLYRYKKTLRELELLLILYTSLSRIGWSPAADEASVCLHEFTAVRIWGRQGGRDSLLRRPRPMQHESNVHVSWLWFRITQVHQASGIFDQRSNVEGPGYVNKIRWVLHRRQSESRLRFFFFFPAEGLCMPSLECPHPLQVKVNRVSALPCGMSSSHASHSQACFASPYLGICGPWAKYKMRPLNFNK